MGKLPVSNKTSSFGKKPYIKKGYYPAQLLSVEPYLAPDGKLKMGTYGTQLIFTFAVFKGHEDSGEPLKPMMFKPAEDKDEVPVVIASFVYHQYKAKNSDELQTAITPNSKITDLLKALGWEFNAEDGVDPEDYLGNWIEVNIDDWGTKEGEEKYIASTIKDFGKYKGPEPKKDLGTVETPKKPADVKKQMNHEDVEKKPVDEDKAAKIKELNEKLMALAGLNKDGLLTDEGYEQSKEQIYSQLEELKK